MHHSRATPWPLLILLSTMPCMPELSVHALLLIVAFSVMTLSSTAHAEFDADRDLVALHYDHAPDRDDAHAAAAGLAVVRALNLRVIAVGGAYGRWNADRYNSDSVAVMNAVWGSEWLDAHARREEALQSSVTLWTQTLNSGADVWIAEGGQADFTAAVVRRISGELPSVNLRDRIHVVQHSDWNEVHADQADLAYVRAGTNYIRIEDGNFENSTADFNQQSQAFVNTVLASQYASAWQAAFDYLDPAEKLDFSDVVELLHIVDIGIDQVRNPEQFAARFIANGTVSSQSPFTRQYWSDSYSVDGQCYCDTNFDHDLDSIWVQTPVGSLPVYQVCADIRSRYGEGRFEGRLYYNTAQCGHGPANTSPDEIDCPGFLTDNSGAIGDFNCSATGALWNLDALYGNNDDNTPAPPTADNSGSPVCVAADSDPDGDGFGWENGASCLASQAVDTVDDNDNLPTNDNESPLEVGNQITEEVTETRLTPRPIVVGGGAFSLQWIAGCLLLVAGARLRRRQPALVK